MTTTAEAIALGIATGQSNATVDAADDVAAVPSTDPDKIYNDIDMQGRTIYNAILPGVSRVLFSSSNVKNVSNTSAKTSLLTAINGIALPEGFWFAGRMLDFQLGGTYQTPPVGGGGVTPRVEVSAVTLAATTVASTALSTNSTINRFYGSGTILCTEAGENGKLYIDANLRFQTNATVTVDVPLNNGGAPITLDTRPASTIDISAQWGTASSAQGTKTNFSIFRST